MRFYDLVSDQFINQTPMGTDGGPPVLTVRYEGYLAALEIHGYPRCMWASLSKGATVLHRLVNKIDVVNWRQEIPRLATKVNAFALVTAEDVS